MTVLLAAMVILASPPVVDPGVRLLSPRHVALVVNSGEQPWDGADNFGILSQDDVNYQQVQRPNRVFVRGYPIELIPEGWPYPSVQQFEAIIELPQPLAMGATYQFGILDTGDDYLYEHHPELNWTPSLKVNQVGYLPEAAGRWAYASHWLGALPPLELAEEELNFRVVNSENSAVALTGRMALRMPAGQGTEDAYMNNYSLATIYDVNLFELVNPGTYHIVWDNVGRSWPFRVGDNVFDDAFKQAFKALYHQRCGIELTADYTVFTRGVCHDRPVTLSNFDAFDGEGSAFEGLPAEATDETVEVTGGYHDAGDYDRRIQHLAVVDALVDLYEIAPTRFALDDLEIPESGNGIPDVLDEALWGVDFFKRLQRNDGGVPAGVETTAHPDGWETAPEDDTETTWYAFAPSVLSSYRYAAAAAKLARAIKPWDEGTARDLLNSATRAFDWAEANRSPDWEHDTYWDAWAAVELLKTTGSGQYDQAFISYMPFRDGDLVFSLPRFQPDTIIEPLIAYLGTERASAEHRDAVRTVLTDRSAYWLESARGMGYRTVKHPFAPVTFGSYTTPVYSGLLFRLFEQLGTADFREWGTYACDLTLGANPAGMSWVTGLGSRSVEKPLHLHSITDDIPQPVPGITVYGPCGSSGCLENQGILAAARAAFVPSMDTWPMAERFADLSFVPVFNEFTVTESIAPTVFAFGYLAELAGGVRVGDGEGGAGGDGGSGAAGGAAGAGGAGGGAGAGGTAGTGGMIEAQDMGGGSGGMGGGKSDAGLPDGDGASAGGSSGGCATVNDSSSGAIIFCLMIFSFCMVSRRRWRP